MAVFLFRSTLARHLGGVRIGILGITRRQCHNTVDDKKTTEATKNENISEREESESPSTRSSSSESEAEHQTSKTPFDDGGEYGVPDDEEFDIKQQILTAALDHVPQFGWTSDSVSAGAQTIGLSGMAEGIFPRGGGDLALFYIEDCNLRLADYLAEQAQAHHDSQDAPPRRSSVIIRDALETRLRMTIPYIDSWPDAMQLMLRPENAPDAIKSVAYMVDEIWYHAGDTSTDYNWYTKRGILAGLYGGTEIYMMQDHSEDFANTWTFLDNRLADIQALVKMRSSFQKSGVGSGQILSSFITTARNIAGFNKRSR